MARRQPSPRRDRRRSRAGLRRRRTYRSPDRTAPRTIAADRIPPARWGDAVTPNRDATANTRPSSTAAPARVRPVRRNAPIRSSPSRRYTPRPELGLRPRGVQSIKDGALDALDRDSLLGHRVALAEGDSAVFQRLDVDRDTPGRADLVLAPIELADRRGVIVDRRHVAFKVVLDAMAELHDLGPLLEEWQHGHLVRRELGVQRE